MLIFIDESGDAGFKLEKGSTQYFVIALVIFDDPLVAEEMALVIKKFRRELNKSDNFEFKFNKLKKEFRIRFLDRIKKYNFRIRAIVFEKKNVYSSKLRLDRRSFYSYAIKLVLKHTSGRINNAQVRIDGLGERLFRRSLNVYLRKELNTQEKKILKNIRFVDSKENVLIQLADMVAGSIKKSYEADKSDSKLYIYKISKRIEDIWEFK